MRRAKIRADEAARLGAVKEYDPGISGSDPALQAVADHAARRFQAPVALVTLVREGDQIFLARTGIDRCSTDRDISFCSHALDSDDLLVVPDAALDPRFSDNPLVLGPPFVRFYAGVPLRAPSGHVLGTLCIIDHRPRHDLSARDRQTLRALGAYTLQTLEDLRLARARAAGVHRFRQLAATSSLAAACTDGAGRITFWNDAAARLLGTEDDEALGRDLADYVPALRMDGSAAGTPLNETTLARFADTVDTDARRADGSSLEVACSVAAFGSGPAHGYAVVLADLGARRRSDELAIQAANRDALTGLPSPAVLAERIAEHIARDEQIHLLRLRFGGYVGGADGSTARTRDAVVQEVGRRIVDSVRNGDTVCRLGCGEYAVLRTAAPDEPRSAALIMADRILGSLASPVELERQRLPLDVQIGIACFPQHAASPEALMAAAEAALAQARRQGGRVRQVFREPADDAATELPDMDAELLQALPRGEFELFYQPQVDLADGHIVGAEALIRWRHPQRGLLAPGDFLDRIEQGPLAAEVGTWVLETACSQAVAWRRHTPGFRMGVNLFETQFRRPDFAGEVLSILDRTGLSPAGLELEITEKIMLSNAAAELEPLVALHAEGVGIAFDDFGTGYASLCMLKAVPLTRLKVDRSFVKDIAADGTDALIVAAVATLGTGLGLDVLAEGIEDAAQCTLLRASGCRTGQGYWFGRPMPASEFEQWVRHKAATGLAQEVRA